MSFKRTTDNTDNVIELKNNEEFEFKKINLTIKNDRLEVNTSHKYFQHFDLL
jgi:hypothetical protein